MLYHINSVCIFVFIIVGILQLWSRSFFGNPLLLFPAYFLTLFCYGLNFIAHAHRAKKEMLYSFGICSIILFNIYLFHLRRVGITLLAFYCLVMLISLAPYVRFPKSVIKYLSAFSFLALPAFNLMSTDLNPNMIAYGNLFFVFLCTLSIDFSRFTKRMLVGLCIYIVAFILIEITECRTVLSLLFLSLFLRIVPSRFFYNKILYKVFFGSILIGGIIFAVFYLYLYFDTMGDMSMELGEKRMFSGREKIWAELFVRTLENGLLCGIKDSTYLDCFPEFNPHSTYVAIFSLYGVVVFILFCVLNLSVLHRFRLSAGDRRNSIVRNCIVFYACFLLSGYTEMNVVNLAYVNVMPLLIAGSQINYDRISRLS